MKRIKTISCIIILTIYCGNAFGQYEGKLENLGVIGEMAYY